MTANHYCRHCGKAFEYQETLYKHLKIEHPNTYNCYECDRKNMTRDELDEHLKGYHSYGYGR